MGNDERIADAWERFQRLQVRSRELCAIAGARRAELRDLRTSLLALRASQLEIDTALSAMRSRLQASLRSR